MYFQLEKRKQKWKWNFVKENLSFEHALLLTNLLWFRFIIIFFFHIRWIKMYYFFFILIIFFLSILIMLTKITSVISVSIQSSEVTQAVFLCSMNILMGMLLTFVFKAKTVYVWKSQNFVFKCICTYTLCVYVIRTFIPKKNLKLDDESSKQIETSPFQWN